MQRRCDKWCRIARFDRRCAWRAASTRTVRHLAGWSGEARNGLPIGRVTRHPERDSEGGLVRMHVIARRQVVGGRLLIRARWRQNACS